MKSLGEIGDLVLNMSTDHLWTGSRALTDNPREDADWDVLLLVKEYAPPRKALERDGWLLLSRETYNVNGLPLLVFEKFIDGEKFNILLTNDKEYYAAYKEAHNLAALLKPEDKFHRIRIFWTVIKQKFSQAKEPMRGQQ